MMAPAFVHGALASMTLALLALVAQASAPPDVDLAGDCILFVEDAQLSTTFDQVMPPACHDDYAPAPPADGAWCGVPLDGP